MGQVDLKYLDLLMEICHGSSFTDRAATALSECRLFKHYLALWKFLTATVITETLLMERGKLTVLLLPDFFSILLAFSVKNNEASAE